MSVGSSSVETLRSGPHSTLVPRLLTQLFSDWSGIGAFFANRWPIGIIAGFVGVLGGDVTSALMSELRQVGLFGMGRRIGMPCADAAPNGHEWYIRYNAR